jgi:hypothetical protein
MKIIKKIIINLPFIFIYSGIIISDNPLDDIFFMLGAFIFVHIIFYYTVGEFIK